ncbi:MAG: ABC transporter substrate-binding protein [Gemmatimonadales bacterium]
MRVVSLIPAATEIVAALGAVDMLVGVTHACDFPAMVASLPRVTACEVDASAPPATIDAEVRAFSGAGRSLHALDEDLIRSLRPDLILTQGLCDVCAVSEADVRALATRFDPVPTIVSLSATSLDGVLEDIARVAVALLAEDEGEELTAGLRARLRSVHDVLKAARAPRPRVVVLEWLDPVYLAGHWVPEMVRRAGGADALAKAGAHSTVVSIDAVVAADPDFVLVAPCGYDLARASREGATLRHLAAWSAFSPRPLWALDGNALTSRPGPRLVDGIEVMARIFNPSLFSPLDDSAALHLEPGAAA